MSAAIGLDAGQAQDVAQGLKQVLADSYALYLKTQNYHWNVTGPLFQAVHAMTEEQYTALADAVDEIAERIRSLGVKAPGSFAAYQALTSLKDADDSLKAEEMVKDLVAGHETVVAAIRQVSEKADAAGDNTTVGLLDDRLADHEKTAWMLRSLVG